MTANTRSGGCGPVNWETFERKVIQIAAVPIVVSGGLDQVLVYALCNDGTVWCRNPFHPDARQREWDKCPDIPQMPTALDSGLASGV